MFSRGLGKPSPESVPGLVLALGARLSAPASEFARAGTSGRARRTDRVPTVQLVRAFEAGCDHLVGKPVAHLELPAFAALSMRARRFDLPRSKRTTRPSTVHAGCPMRPLAEEPSDWVHGRGGSGRVGRCCCHGVVTDAPRWCRSHRAARSGRVVRSSESKGSMGCANGMFDGLINAVARRRSASSCVAWRRRPRRSRRRRATHASRPSTVRVICPTSYWRRNAQPWRGGAPRSGARRPPHSCRLLDRAKSGTAPARRRRADALRPGFAPGA